MGEPQRDLALEVIRKFLSLYRYLRCYSRKTQNFGVRGREFATLRYLLEAGPRKISEVQDYIYISPSTTSEMLSRLEDAGYVARTRCKKDQRVVFVELTPEGRRLAEETPLGGIPLLRERIKTLPAERLATMNQAFKEFLDLMEIENK